MSRSKLHINIIIIINDKLIDINDNYSLENSFHRETPQNYAAVPTVVLNGYKTVVSRLACKQGKANIPPNMVMHDRSTHPMFR